MDKTEWSACPPATLVHDEHRTPPRRSQDKEEEAHRYRERIADVREALARYDEDGGQRAVIRTGSDPDPSHANGSQRHSAGWQTLQRIRKVRPTIEVDFEVYRFH